jgi:hypothetical protein
MVPIDGHGDGRSEGTRPPPITDPSVRSMHITAIKQRIARSAYTVDADAVAEALLRHPGTRRAIVPTPAVSRPGARIRRDGATPPRG